MIVDLQREAPPERFVPAVCIVGAGAAGIVLAAELIRRRIPVLLLESGGARVEDAAQALGDYEPAGQPQQPPRVGRSRVLGGTTKSWGGQILPLTAEDFKVRDWIAGSGWPFPRETLDPFYTRALGAEGLDSAIPEDERIWRRIGMPMPALGSELLPYFTRWCPEPDFARLHRAIFASPHLCVALHATVTGLMLSDTRKKIAGLSYRTPAGKEGVFSAEQYVFCLGTIDTVRLLLQPQRDGHAAPWNASGLLGRNLQCHIDLNAAVISPLDSTRLHNYFANVYAHGLKYHPKFRLAPAVQQRERMLNIAGFVTARHPAERSLIRVKAMGRHLLHGRFEGISRQDLSAAAAQLPILLKLADGYIRQHRAYWVPGSDIRLRVHCEQEPLSASILRLTTEHDAAGMLRACLDWQVSPSEWATIRKFTQRVDEDFRRSGIAKLSIHPELLRDDGFSGLTFENSHHVMGGSRMADDPREGVVTPDLRLHGVRNAFICSASVFPTSGFSNPTHTLIALAIRLADHLAAQAEEPNA